MAPLNPRWIRDEVILALDLYFRIDAVHSSAQTPEIIQLSKLLRSLPFHPAEQRNPKFRNPVGIHMILCNFLALDPHYRGKGLTRGSKLQKQVWSEFSQDVTTLAMTAKNIVTGLPEIAAGSSFSVDVEEEFLEGKILTAIHKTRERSSTVVRRKKVNVLAETGSLRCEVCDFDFAVVYGELGAGFAECHHTIPLSQKGIARTKQSDLAIVCANCHRMFHRNTHWLTLEQLREIVLKNRTRELII